MKHDSWEIVLNVFSSTYCVKYIIIENMLNSLFWRKNQKSLEQEDDSFSVI